MIRLDVRHPVRPFLVGDREVVVKYFQRNDLQLVELMHGNVGNGMPEREMSVMFV